MDVAPHMQQANRRGVLHSDVTACVLNAAPSAGCYGNQRDGRGSPGGSPSLRAVPLSRQVGEACTCCCYEDHSMGGERGADKVSADLADS